MDPSTSNLNQDKEAPPGPQRSNSQSSLHKSHNFGSHRQSFAENLRGMPSSPRAQRHPSFTQAAVQELLNNPPAQKPANPRFAGRDWRDIAIGELVSKEDVKWVELDTSVEDATMALVKNAARNVVLIRENPASKTAMSTFDYNDLNAYLLVVVGLARPDEEHLQLYNDIAQKAQERIDIPLREILPVCRKESLVSLQRDETLDKAIEIFGGGIHRILVTNPAGDIVGILSQLRLMEFFFNEGVHFRAIDELYPRLLRDLEIGSRQIIAVDADSILTDALRLMNDEGLTSVAVVDNGSNVVGNISTVDVKLLTNATSLPLLKSSCMHFISVILTERGTEMGKDSFPVFHVNPYSTLAHTVAKLVATRAHRMWVVESASPSPSAPATPLLTPVQSALVPGSMSSHAAGSSVAPATFPSVPAATLPGSHISGKLTGVITLTDILNLFAKSTGLNPTDPSEQRARRRRSSSSSIRPSIEGSRSSIDLRR